MGIPSFYRWLIENYPKVLCNQEIDDNKTKFKSLYIDMNGVIHTAVRFENNGNMRGELIKAKDLSDDMIKSSLFFRLDQIIYKIKPNHILYIAIDGVPPRAKSIEQRKRRFKSSKETTDTLKKRALSNRNGTMTLPDKDVYFDSNCISPATDFMMNINAWVEEYLLKVSERFKNLNIIFSDSTVKGEGEHKIMDFIREYQASRHYIKEETHIFYGMDADLIFLGLSTHEKNFYVLRDPLDLIQCHICKSNDGHLPYECTSAHAKRRIFVDKTSSITVKNIPIQTDEALLRKLFSAYGDIISIKIEKSNTKRGTLIALIEFKDKDTVDEIVARGGSWYINNERLLISVIYTKGLKAENDENQDNSNNNNNNEGQENTNNTHEEEDEEVANNTLFLSNLDQSISRFDVESKFSEYGKIEKIQILPSPRFPKQKFVMVTYSDQASARNAYKSSKGLEFFGSEITVKKAIRDKEPETQEQKEAREKKSLEMKEKRTMEREFKIQSFIGMAEPKSTKETALFYLGHSDWDLEKAYQLYLEYDKAPLEYPNREVVLQFDFVKLNNFRQYFTHHISLGLTNEQKQLIDSNRCINDFTLMSMLLGNDFLPHLPALNIQAGSIELILTWYKDFIYNSITKENQVRYLTTKDSNNIIFENFLPLLKVLTNWESHIYPEKLEKQLKKEEYRNYKYFNSPGPSSLSTSPDSPKIHTLKDLNQKSSDSPKKSIDDFEFSFNYEPHSYYKTKLSKEYQEEKDELIKRMCKSYIEGLTWVLRYYTHGCKSWEWFYPFHYAPLSSDLEQYVMNNQNSPNTIEFELGNTLPPLVHLTSVLPIYSAKFLPESLQKLMLPPSPVSHYYKEDFKIDLNGEDVPWKGVVLLDFMDFSQLNDLASPSIQNLSENELERNKIGNNKLIVNNQVQEFDNVDLVDSNEYQNDNNNHQILNQRDLNWSTRKIYSMSPLPSPIEYPKVCDRQPPSNQNTEVQMSESQTKFLEWRKLNGFNQSLEILDSIDSSKSNSLNFDKKLSTSSLSRLFSNEISQSHDIKLFSQDDPQLIVNIGFSKPTKVSGIKILSSFPREFLPKTLKIYINSNIDFSTTSNEKYKFEYSNENQFTLSDPTYFSFPDLKLKPIQSLSIFIENNFNGDKGVTKIEKIILL